jgi:hypothetical protein
VTYTTFSVVQDPGRGSWFWCAWKEPIKGWRTRKTPDAHGWAASHIEASVAAVSKAREWGEPVLNADVGRSVLGWKKYAAPGHTRVEERAREEAADKVRRDAYVADFTARLESARAVGLESWFWEQERRSFQARREALFGDSTGALAELGLKSGATADEIRKAYKRLALSKHPDHGGTTEAFVKLTKARDTALTRAEMGL